jgi:hypothetical protein
MAISYPRYLKVLSFLIGLSFNSDMALIGVFSWNARIFAAVVDNHFIEFIEFSRWCGCEENLQASPRDFPRPVLL